MKGVWTVGMRRPPTSLAVQRFWQRFERLPNGCWQWTGTVRPEGYANHGNTTAHRFAYELLRGPIPNDLVLDHICHDPTVCVGGKACLHRRCVNPDHMRLVTTAENLAGGRRCNWHAAAKAST